MRSISRKAIPTRPRRKCATASKAICAAAPATTISSRASWPARARWEASYDGIPDRRADPAQGGLPLPHRRRHVYRRCRAAGADLRGVREIASRARQDQEDFHGSGKKILGGACGLYGRRSGGGEGGRPVGERVAVVIAESLAQARDAAELIEVDYEVLPAVVDPVRAKGAPPIHEAAPDNTCYV